jgi:hypothetical protein
MDAIPATALLATASGLHSRFNGSRSDAGKQATAAQITPATPAIGVAGPAAVPTIDLR